MKASGALLPLLCLSLTAGCARQRYDCAGAGCASLGMLLGLGSMASLGAPSGAAGPRRARIGAVRGVPAPIMSETGAPVAKPSAPPAIPAAAHSAEPTPASGSAIKHSRPAPPLPVTPVEATAFCDAVEAQLATADCNQVQAFLSHLRAGRAAISVPPRMVRGAVAHVRFAVVAGTDQRAANDQAAITQNSVIAVDRVKQGRFMEAALSGEGFAIKPLSPAIVDAFVSGQSVWEWEVRPLRADRHYLRMEAWVLFKRADGSFGRAVPVFYPPVEVAVPVRWWPDRIGDALDDSQAWLSRGENWLKAAATFLAAALAAWLAIRKFRTAEPGPATKGRKARAA